MNIPKTFDPTQCCGRASKYSIEGCRIVHYRDRHYVASTNGRSLSMLPAEVELDESTDAVWPTEAFAAARKLAIGGFARLSLNGAATATDGRTWPAMDLRFPDVGSILDGVYSQGVDVVLTIDPTELLRLARALGAADGVTLRIATAVDRHGNRCAPIRVEPDRNGGGAVGVIMPKATR